MQAVTDKIISICLYIRWVTAIFILFFSFAAIAIVLSDDFLKILMFMTSKTDMIQCRALILGYYSMSITALSAIFAVVEFFSNKYIVSAKPSPGDEKSVSDKMVKMFRNANKVVIISGYFDWLVANDRLYDLLVEFIKVEKVKLHSCRNREIVENRLGYKFSNLESGMSFNFKADIRCSYIKKCGRDIFLYLETSDDGRQRLYTLKAGDAAHNLVSILTEMMNAS